VPGSKDVWSYTSTPPVYLHGVVLSEAQEQLYLYHYLGNVIKNVRGGCISESPSKFDISITFMLEHPVFTNKFLVTKSWQYLY